MHGWFSKLSHTYDESVESLHEYAFKMETHVKVSTVRHHVPDSRVKVNTLDEVRARTRLHNYFPKMATHAKVSTTVHHVPDSRVKVTRSMGWER